MSTKIQAIRGMNDVLPDEAQVWAELEVILRTWLKAYGYREMRMPLVEQTALFARSIGETTDIVEKEMYSFVDSLNGENLTLRPEGTASCLRAVIEHNLLYPGPQRLWYSGPMFRHEKPQKGRYRQFHQFGVEALGFPGPDVDAELIIMTARLWRQLGLQQYRLELNTLGDLPSRARFRSRLVSHFARFSEVLGPEEQRRLEKNPLRLLDSKNPALTDAIRTAPSMLDVLDDASHAHFQGLQDLLKAAGVDYSINPRLVRGLDYYNATVFEWVTDLLGAQGTFCAGGRYDGLFEQLGGKPAPGCGYAMGVERLLALWQESGRPTNAQGPHGYIVHSGVGAQSAAVVAAESFRDAELDVVLHCGEGGFKSQMKKADASGARFAIIIGEDEVAQTLVTVKPLRVAGEQSKVSVEAAIELIKREQSHGSI